jgi:acyl-CoA thioesterase-2
MPGMAEDWDRSAVVDQEAVDRLVSLLDLEVIEVNLFRGISPDVTQQRVFGGQVAGQAMVAAARTVDAEDGGVHSLHAYFLRPGDPSVPILYQVDRIRDGRSFTTRRVVAIQHGKPIFHLSASFQRTEPGMEHQSAMPTVTAPESLPSFRERWAPHAEELGDWYTRPRPIDFRTENWSPGDRRAPLPPIQRVWFKASGKLPDDPVLHTCILTYASDMTLLDTTTLPHGGEYDDKHMQVASLDHAMWFHRPFRADEWLLYDQDSPSASGARGLARGLVYAHDGALIATVMQEGLIRRVAP